ncbi:MAG: hypothetical protein EZS28_037677, partial [Streblomastix strix]
MTIESTASLLTHPSEILNSKQTNGRESASIDDPPIFVNSTAVACAHQDSIKNDNPGRKRRRLCPGCQDEKVKEALATWKNDDCLIRGNRGEELFIQISNQRSLTSTAIYNLINGWHEEWRRHHQRFKQFVEYGLKYGKRREDLLNVEELELVIANFISQSEADDATNANQAQSQSASNTLFQLQGFKKVKISGVVLQQIV